MKNLKASGIFILSLAPLIIPRLAGATAAYEAPPSVFYENSVGVSTATEYFSTSANHEPSRGDYTNLPSGNSLTHWQTHLRGRYTPSTRFSLFAGTTFAQTAAITSFQTKTNSAFTQAFGGLDWLITTEYLQLTAEAIISFPLDVPSETQTRPMTTDGVNYFRPGLFAQKAFKRFRVGAYGGVHVPVGALATRFLYEMTIDTRVFWAITAGAGINGYETLVGDTSTLVARQTTAGIANAGSERFYSYNPSLIEARAWLGFRPNKKFWIRAGYGQTINGFHNAAGSTMMLSLAYNTQSLYFGSLEDRPAAPPPRPISPDERLRSFEPDLEAVEDDLFNMDDGTAPPVKKSNPLDQTERMLEKKNRDR